MVRNLWFFLFLGVLLAGIPRPVAAGGGTIADVKERGVLDPKTGEVVGIDVDLARAVADRLKVPLRTRIVTSQTWIPYLLNRDVDIIAATVEATPDRAKLVDFSLAYFKTAHRVLARKGSVTALEDLAGRRIGTTRGTAEEEHIRSVVPSASCFFFTDPGKAVEALRKGEIDAISGSGKVLYGCLSSLPQNEFEIPGSVKLSEGGFRIAVRKGEPEFLELVNRTLSDLNEKGNAKRIFDKWFGMRGEEAPVAESAAPGAVGVVTRPTSAQGRFLVIPVQGTFRPGAPVSVFDPQGDLVGEGTGASIYEEETYVDAKAAPAGLIQPGFAATMGYDNLEARDRIRSRKEVIDRVIQASNEEQKQIRREIARKTEQEQKDRERFQEDMSKTRMYLDYQYSDYYYRFR